MSRNETLAETMTVTNARDHALTLSMSRFDGATPNAEAELSTMEVLVN